MSLMSRETSRPGTRLFFLALMHKILVDEIRHVPDWAKFVAMDASGEIFAFSHPPSVNLFCSCWITQRQDASLIEQIGLMAPIEKQGLDWEHCCISVTQLIEPERRRQTEKAAAQARLLPVEEILQENEKDAWI